MTTHGLGFRAVAKAFPNVQLNENRVLTVLTEIFVGYEPRELRFEKPVIVNAVIDLVRLCKLNLVNLYNDERDYEALNYLATYYDVDLDGRQAEIFPLIPRVIERCKNVLKDGAIDYTDMIWLPVVLNLPVFQYDMLLVDEAQDLTQCQHALVSKAGKRLILCGDPRQSIYGFAGADTESMPRITEVLSITPRGCTTLYLTYTRRCGRAIVAEAKTLVPDFEAFETNPPGKISKAPYLDIAGRPANGWLGMVQDGDMVLSRVTAPLISACFKFLKMGRKANVQGRDEVGSKLIRMIERFKAESVPDLIRKVEDWAHREIEAENNKRHPREAYVMVVNDKKDCLLQFCENAATIEDIKKRIDAIFTDDKQVHGIRLSSIHKAKGLEARHVFLFRNKVAPLPHPMAKLRWEQEQEQNLLYVAITRAIEELTYVV